ncbi:hypothetical protein AALP_AA8G192100 [Arabis alpina]|uniref:Uncharacterized protein n=1 Tax=Arabis alpina TaxID=50452 RepID=A0A087G814_ARAAL|nr:hypothetical protein AALP_AA8G192100 [Arabis alpina]
MIDLVFANLNICGGAADLVFTTPPAPKKPSNSLIRMSQFLKANTPEAELSDELILLIAILHKGAVDWTSFDFPSIRRATGAETFAAPSSTQDPIPISVIPLLLSSAPRRTLPVRKRRRITCSGTGPSVPLTSMILEQVPSVNATEMPSAAARQSTRSLSGLLPHLKSARSRSPRGSGSDGKDSSPNSSGSGGGRPFHWSYSHSWDFPVADDPEGLAHLFRHVKLTGCSIPAVKNLHLRRPYVKLTSTLGKL